MFEMQLLTGDPFGGPRELDGQPSDPSRPEINAWRCARWVERHWALRRDDLYPGAHDLSVDEVSYVSTLGPMPTAAAHEARRAFARRERGGGRLTGGFGRGSRTAEERREAERLRSQRRRDRDRAELATTNAHDGTDNTKGI